MGRPLALQWVTARASGQDEKLDPEGVRRVAAQAEVFGDALRAPGACGPAVDPPPAPASSGGWPSWTGAPDAATAGGPPTWLRAPGRCRSCPGLVRIIVSPIVEFRVLGPVELVDSGRPVAIGSARRRVILAALLIHAGQLVSSDRLVDVLWGERPPPGARGALHSHVSRLRRALGTGGGRPLQTRGHGYVLDIAADDLDAARFERLARQARAELATDPRRAVALLDEALALWRGAAYAEFADEEFARAEAGRLAELRLVAAEERIDGLLALDRHAEVVSELEAALARHPLRERPCGQLMLARYRLGRTAEALDAYRSLRERLAEELGLDPSPELQRLHAGILAQADWLDGQRAAAGARSPAPALPLTSFVGREDALGSLPALLDRARVVTLTGAGGAGKTRLAAELAARLGDRYADGVRRVELAPVREAEAVPLAVASALGISRQGTEPLLDRLVAALRPRRALVLLDNCEHVLPAVADLVEGLASGCPKLSVLSTSRERLAVSGEHVWLVPPLAVPGPTVPRAELARVPSVRLFCDRATAADPGFALDEHGPAVARICRHLDGVPLAIELAAARTRALSPADLAERLDDRFGVLTGGPRGGAGRHRTLRATVDWSYELLEPPEALLFDRLSVFAGSFDLAAAEDVCTGHGVTRGEVAGLIATLVDKSVLGCERGATGSRYRLLETLREYGAERLAARGESAGMARAHADYYVRLAERADADIRGPDEARAVAVLDRELDNLRAAHHWAVSVDSRVGADLALRLSAALHFYALPRLHDEVLGWAVAAAGLPAAEGHPLRATAYGSASRGIGHRGEFAAARDLGECGLAAAIQEAARIGPLDALGVLALYEGRLPECQRHARDAARLSDAAGEAYHAQWARHLGSLAAIYSGDPTAPGLVEEARRGAAQLGNPTQLACALYAQGEAVLNTDPDRAVALLEQAIALALPVRGEFLRGVALVSMSSARGRSADPAGALSSFREIVDHWWQAGDWTHQWTTLRNLVEPLVRLGLDEFAGVLLGASAAAASAPPVFGTGADQLAQAEAEIRNRLGDQPFERAAERGRAMADDDLIRFVLAELDSLLPG